MDANVPSSTKSSGIGIFLAALGGALLGAAAVFVADKDNRKLLLSYVDKTGVMAARVPAVPGEAKHGISIDDYMTSLPPGDGWGNESNPDRWTDISGGKR